MEIPQGEILQKKTEIDELAKLHNLEDWQKDRLLQEFVRRKSMGYELSILDLATEWGWVKDGEMTPMESGDLSATVESVEEESPLPQVEEVVQEPEPEVTEMPVESQPTVEQVSTPEMPAVESEVQPQPQPVVEQQEQQPIVEQVPTDTTAVNYDNVISIGYKPTSPEYQDPNKVKEMAESGPINSAGTWIANIFAKAWGKVSGS